MGAGTQALIGVLLRGIAQERLWARPLRGGARVELGDVAGGPAEIAEGLEAQAFTRSALLRPYFYTLHAGALLRANRFANGERALAIARWVPDP